MRNSRTGFSRFLVSAASLIAASTAALAGEQILEFKLVTKMIDPKIVQAANIDGQTMMTSNAFGVAFFKDGRSQRRTSSFRMTCAKARAPCTYTFDDGSSIT